MKGFKGIGIIIIVLLVLLLLTSPQVHWAMFGL